MNDSEPVTVAQFHSNPDPGETTKSPHLELTIDGSDWILINRYDANKITTRYPPSFTRLDFNLGPIQKGKWVDWVVHAKWTYQSSGDGVKVVNRTGPNSYNDDTNQLFGFGIYKWPWKSNPPATLTTITMDHDAVKIGDANSSYTQVAPSGTAPSSSPIPTATPTQKVRM